MIRGVAFGAAAAFVVTALLAAATGHHAPLPTISALVLAPAAAVAAALAAARLAGPKLAVAAALVYAALPAVGLAYCLRTYRHTFLHAAAPALVGLRRPWLLAIGVAVCVALAYAPRVVVVAGGLVAAVVAVAVWGVHPLASVRAGVHETGWSITFAEWVAVAGVAGVARRSPAVAVGAGGWLVFAVLRAASYGYADAGFWRQLAPAAPVIALCLTSLALLVPPLRRARVAADAR
jgi:hypothetical protein